MGASRAFRIVCLWILKWIGLFSLSRFATRQGLRIIAYHGVSIFDEHLFRPGLFVTPQTFIRRMRWLRSSGFPVLPLEQAMQKFHSGTLPAGATVITFDDGWHSSHAAAHELHRLSLPATFYITTYYVTQQQPIFNLFVAYAMWRGGKQTVLFDGKERTASEISSLAPGFGREGRLAAMKRVAELTDTSFDEVAASRRLNLMDENQIKDLLAMGFDVQLHTHRHRTHSCPDKLRKEISDNRAVLEKLTGRTLRQFCYPSGRYFAETPEVLKAEGIESAVTTDSGLNHPGRDPFTLYRFLDSERVSQIEYEAEFSGFLDIVRRIKARLTNVPLTAPLIPEREGGAA